MNKAELWIKGKKHLFEAREVHGHPVPRKGSKVFDVFGVKILTDYTGRVLTEGFGPKSKVT